MRRVPASTGPGSAVLLALLLLGGAVSAQTAPPGGNVRSLAADPFHAGLVLLGTTNGAVYRSVDNGRDWSFCGQITPQGDWVVASLVADPARPGRWYAGLWSWRQAQQGGLFVSDDGGRTWRELSPHIAVRALAIAPSDGNELVAGTMDGVYRSLDAGHSWVRISPQHNRELSMIDSVAIDPQDGQQIYVGTWHLPWKTFNGGHDWWQMRQGVIDDSDVFSITVDQTHPTTVYMSACSGIYRSDDRGLHFQKIGGIPYSARRTPVLVQDVAHPATIYAGTTQGLWVTTDRGAHWQRVTSPQLQIEAVLLTGGRVLLGTEFAGVWRNGADGGSFTPSNRGFSDRHVAATAASPTGTYYAVNGDQTWGGVFFRAREDAWEALPLPPAQVGSLHWSPAGLIAGTDEGIFRWDAVERRWKAIGGVPVGPVYALASPTAEGLNVYAATARGLYRSDDGGARWQWMREAPAPLYRVLASPGGWVWIAGAGYVMTSDDHGQHFLPGRLSLNRPGEASAQIYQLALASLPLGGWQGHPLLGSPSRWSGCGRASFQGTRDPAALRASPGCRAFMLLAATSSGLYRSQDLGRHWMLCGHGLPEMAVTEVHAQAGGVYALGELVGEVYRSGDGGGTWSAVRLPEPVEVLARNVPGLGLRWPVGDARKVNASGIPFPSHEWPN